MSCLSPKRRDYARLCHAKSIVGVVTQTLINYEQRGLVKPRFRSEAGHRLYGTEEVAQLRFIKRANLAWLTLAEAKDLLTLIAEGERGENIPQIKEVLEERLRETERRCRR